MNINELTLSDIESIKSVILAAFSGEPWNDQWDDEKQFHSYIIDLIGNKNSLSLGLYDNNELIGVALGRIKHWYEGNEFWIDDFGIIPKAQGHGNGSKFLDMIEEYLKEHNASGIVLFTNRDIPAYRMYIKKGFAEEPHRVFFKKKLI